jgi:hypothetical protein
MVGLRRAFRVNATDRKNTEVLIKNPATYNNIIYPIVIVKIRTGKRRPRRGLGSWLPISFLRIATVMSTNDRIIKQILMRRGKRLGPSSAASSIAGGKL